MSSVDWEEVKRLAADFQRAQLSSTIQRLSERNCIEIINLLVEQKQIDVVYTTDGKEYITPQHLMKEIRDELYVHGGRINFVELTKILSVDLSVISTRASDIERTDHGVRIINGQLIDETYVASLCEEISEKLQQQGQVTVGDLTSQYDLPSEYLLSIIEKQLGKAIKGQQDKQDRQVFFTQAFVERNMSIVRGALLAVTKPTPLATLLNICGAQEKLFFSVVDALVAAREMPGLITGKQGINSVFVPAIYTRSQIDWVDNFYKQNGYLELTAIVRLGIAEPVAFVKKHFGGAGVTVLHSCAAGPLILGQVEAAVEDMIATGSLVNILPILPSVFEEKDAELILQQVLKTKGAGHSLHIFDSTVVVTEHFLRDLLKLFDEVLDRNALNSVTSGSYVRAVLDKSTVVRNVADDERGDSKPDRREERRKKAAEGKGGGGTQGRETKTKSTKKKYMKGKQNEDSDDEAVVTRNAKNSQRLELVRLADIKAVLEVVPLVAEEDSERLVEDMALHLHPGLNKTALELAQRHYEATIASTNQNRRKKHGEMQEKLNDLVMNIRLFEKGLKQFPQKEVQQQLAKYLLKTVCTDVTNEIFLYVALENMKQFEEGKEMTPELRVKVLNEVPSDLKETLQKVHKSLTAASLDDFLGVVEAAAGPGVCDVVLRKADKKKERPAVANHRQQLAEQLAEAQDPALVLHLAALLVFQAATQTMLHASGRFVATILTLLQTHLQPEEFTTLHKYHDLVLKLLTSSDEAEKSAVEASLQEGMAAVKQIALSYKKSDKNRLASE